MKRLTPEILGKIETLQLRARTLVESVLTGSHRGQQRGFSVDFAEHREYSPGDDVRHLDWKLYGKQDRFYVRQFEDENQLQAWLLVDCSGSMSYRSKDSHLSKLEYAATILAAIGWLACYQRDRSALVLFDSENSQVTGPVFGTVGAKRLIDQLETVIQEASTSTSTQPDEEDNLQGMNLAAEIVPPHSVVFLVTDAFGEANEFRRVLSLLQHKHCDVRLLHVMDPAEIIFPFDGNTLFKGLEGGEYQTQAQAIRNDYLKEVELFLAETRRLAGQSHCEYCFIETSSSCDVTLRQILSSRRKS